MQCPISEAQSMHCHIIGNKILNQPYILASSRRKLHQYLPLARAKGLLRPAWTERQEPMQHLTDHSAERKHRINYHLIHIRVRKTLDLASPLSASISTANTTTKKSIRSERPKVIQNSIATDQPATEYDPNHYSPLLNNSKMPKRLSRANLRKSSMRYASQENQSSKTVNLDRNPNTTAHAN